MKLETRHLQLIEAIRRTGTLTDAAKTLHVTQPAASHTLRELERRLGVELFVRGPKGMTASVAGRRLLDTADRVLPELERAEKDLGELGSGMQGTLRLTTECYTCYHWMPRLLGAFSQAFPGIVLQIVPEATRRPIEALLEHEVDLAILHRDPNREEILTRELTRDELLAVFAPDHRFSAVDFLEAGDFADEHLILHHDYPSSDIATRLLEPAGIRPARVSELQLTEAVIEVVKAGLGVGILARWAIGSELEAGSLKAARLSAEGLHRTWRAATLKRNSANAALGTLVDLLATGSF